MSRTKDDGKKLDLRVVKTKKLLSAALLELMEEKPIDNITVQEICSQAMINRMTFYKHYADKYDLLCDSMKSLQSEIVDKVEKSCSIESDPVVYCVKLVQANIEYCESKRDVLRKLIEQDNAIASDIINTSMQTNVERFLNRLKGDKEFYCPTEYVASFITGGSAKLVLEWIANDKNYTKEQFLADILPFFSAIIGGDALFKKKETL